MNSIEMWIYEAITLCGSTSVFIGEAFSNSQVSESLSSMFVQLASVNSQVSESLSRCVFEKKKCY